MTVWLEVSAQRVFTGWRNRGRGGWAGCAAGGAARIVGVALRRGAAKSGPLSVRARAPALHRRACAAARAAGRAPGRAARIDRVRVRQRRKARARGALRAQRVALQSVALRGAGGVRVLARGARSESTSRRCTSRRRGGRHRGARFFAPGERECLPRRCELEERGRSDFFGCWTRKEAFVKALGDGLAVPLERLDASAPPRGWSIESFSPEPGFIGALAVQE